MEEKEIQNTVLNILQTLFKFPKELLNNLDFDLPLTGRDIHLNAIELTYLFLEIEKVFMIHFEPKDITNYKINSVNKIVSAISKHQVETYY